MNLCKIYISDGLLCLKHIPTAMEGGHGWWQPLYPGRESPISVLQEISISWAISRSYVAELINYDLDMNRENTQRHLNPYKVSIRRPCQGKFRQVQEHLLPLTEPPISLALHENPLTYHKLPQP